jgi:hypothetical protein
MLTVRPMGSPPSKDVKDRAAEQLRVHGHTCSAVLRVWSAGDSDFDVETILFVDGDGAAQTALLFPHFGDKGLVKYRISLRAGLPGYRRLPYDGPGTLPNA